MLSRVPHCIRRGVGHRRSSGSVGHPGWAKVDTDSKVVTREIRDANSSTPYRSWKRGICIAAAPAGERRPLGYFRRQIAVPGETADEREMLEAAFRGMRRDGTLESRRDVVRRDATRQQYRCDLLYRTTKRCAIRSGSAQDAVEVATELAVHGNRQPEGSNGRRTRRARKRHGTPR
jgi:hypothetical protein